MNPEKEQLFHLYCELSVPDEHDLPTLEASKEKLDALGQRLLETVFPLKAPGEGREGPPKEGRPIVKKVTSPNGNISISAWIFQQMESNDIRLTIRAGSGESHYIGADIFWCIGKHYGCVRLTSNEDGSISKTVYVPISFSEAQNSAMEFTLIS